MNIEAFETILISDEIKHLTKTKQGQRRLKRAIKQFKRGVIKMTQHWLKRSSVETLNLLKPAQTLEGINFIATIVHNTQANEILFLISAYCPNEPVHQVRWIEVSGSDYQPVKD